MLNSSLIKKSGSWGEKLAASFLKQKGFKILETNFRSRFGEIDIIAQDKKGIAFVEVKTYADKNLISPQEAIFTSKRKKIIKTAKYYLFKNKITDNARFDVIAITLDSAKEPSLEYFKDAFRVK